MKPYSEAFKAKMVQKMTGAGAVSASGLSRQIGIHQTTLSEWKRKAVMRKSSTPARRPQDWTAQEKLEVLLEAASFSEEELGGFLRRRGLHQAHLKTWREEVFKALQSDSRKSSQGPAQKRRIRELERELHRKEKALVEASALLMLQKKARAIWEDEGDTMTPRSER